MIAFETIGRLVVIVYACGNKMLLNFKFVGLHDVLLFLTDRVLSEDCSIFIQFDFSSSSSILQSKICLNITILICPISII